MATARSLRPFVSSLCQSCRQRLLPAVSRRAFSSTPSHKADNDDFLKNYGNTSTEAGRRRRVSPSSAANPEGMSISELLDVDNDTLLSNSMLNNLNESAEMDKPHRLHIYSTKHNTHITLVQPQRSALDTVSSGISGTTASATEKRKQIDTLISLSAGNIGFKKAGRGSYDAAYQLAAFTLKQIQEKGILRDIQRLEVVLRGFGAGREACTKALLGSEGRNLRHKITSVVDATRLKQGGPRSKKPRRLG